MKYKKVSVSIPNDFATSVSFGKSVDRGTILGTGTIETPLEVYILPTKYTLYVDSGVFITKGQKLLEFRDGVEKRTVFAKHDGLVRLEGKFLKVVDVLANAPIKSPVKGRVVLLSRNEIIIEADYCKIPLFIAEGSYYKGQFVFLKRYNPEHARMLAQDYGLVFWGHALTYNMYKVFVAKGIRGIIAPFIDWTDYTKILKERNSDFAVGLLFGFGGGELWHDYSKIFGELNKGYVEVDFAGESIYLFNCDILFSSTSLYAFKGIEYWAKEIDKIRGIDSNYFLAETKGEKYILTLDEIYKYGNK